MRICSGVIGVVGVVGIAALSCQSPVRAPVTSAAQPAPSSAAPLPPPHTAEVVPLGPLPTDVRPLHEALAFTIDPSRDRFSGTADLTLRLARPTDRIWLHGRGLTVTTATVTPASGAALPARWEEVDPTGVVRVALPAAVSGDVVLHVAFEAAYDASLVGVYRVTTSAGPAVFSKFEAIYARRAFPCFDEPAFKIPYDVTLTVPATDEVIGNMPIAAQTTPAPDRKQVRFQTTPPLPSYLIAFAVGPFERRATSLPPTALRPSELPINVVALRGRGADMAYALDETPRLVAEQERYFGIAFPFPKLDLIAVPDFQSGAMENAGAITFRDSALLVDDQVTSLEQRINITQIIAHETAHQWFGDLVTMRWWNDLWLNEGFATFLAAKTVRAARPALDAELEATDKTNKAMELDGLSAARRIRQPIETTHDITNAFDGITYSKGAAVLTMLEHFLGEEPFRRGLREFLTEHAGGNATTDDLLGALERAADRPVALLASSFLDQPGVPAVTARLRCEAGRGRVELEQTRWRPVGSALKDDATWMIPVCVRAGSGNRVEQACTVLGARSGSLALSGCADWVMPNADAAGYYRALLAGEDLVRLRDRGLAKLSVAERLQFAHDLSAAFSSAALPADDVLRAMALLARDKRGTVAEVPIADLRFIDLHMVNASERTALRAHITALYAPAAAALGWKPAAGEAPWRQLYRASLLNFLALGIEDPAILRTAARHGRRLLGVDADGVRHPDTVAPDLARLALTAAARTGGAVVFDALLAELARSDDAQARARLLQAIGATREAPLIARALDLSIAPQLRKNERLVILKELGSDPDTRDLAWQWLTVHFDDLTPLLPDRYGGQLPGAFVPCDTARAEAMRTFFASRVEALTGGPRNLAQALEQSQQCISLVDAQRPAVQRYLASLRNARPATRP